jgi:adenylate cyclase class 2
MYEIEVKAKLQDKEAVIVALEKLGCTFGAEISQDDMVYAKKVGSLEEFLGNSEFLRLRTENGGRTLFTLKHHPERKNDLSSAPLELEVVVDSRQTMEKMLSLLGFSEMVSTKKRRRKGVYQQWEVCVDEVEGLGAFIELEECTDTREDTAKIQERMRAFLASIGIKAEDYQTDRYDVLLINKKLATQP